MRTEPRTSLVRLAAALILAGLLSGCDRVGLLDMAKNGVDVVYAMGPSSTTQLYIARPDYYKQYDTMTTISPIRMATSGRAVFVYTASPDIYTNQESFDSWGQLLGTTPPPPDPSFMVGLNDEVLALDVGSQIMYRLHEDSFQETEPYTDHTDLTAALGAFSPIFMFKSHNSEAVYLIAADDIDVRIFSVTGGDLHLIGTSTTISVPGVIVSAGSKGSFFYMLDSGGIIYRMDISSGSGAQYASISATSMAVTDSGIYLYQSAGGNLFKFDPSDGSVSGNIHIFSTATGGEIQPFDRDGVAIRIEGGVDVQGVWIYKDKKLERIIPGNCESMYVQ